MLRDHRGGAVVDVDPRVQGLEAKTAVFAWSDLHYFGAAARTADRVQVDAVRDTGVGRVMEVDLDGVALADAQHGAWHGAVEGPVLIGDAVCHLRGDLLGGEVEFHVPR